MLGHGYSATRADTVFCGNGGPLPKPRAPCVLEDTLQPEWESFFFSFLKLPGGESEGAFFQGNVMSEKQQASWLPVSCLYQSDCSSMYGGDVPVVLKGVSPGLSQDLYRVKPISFIVLRLYQRHDERQKPFSPCEHC